MGLFSHTCENDTAIHETQIRVMENAVLTKKLTGEMYAMAQRHVALIETIAVLTQRIQFLESQASKHEPPNP